MRHHIGWIAILFLGALASAQSNKLKVYIAADMEGIGGVSTWEVQGDTKGREYEKFRHLMTQEVNAAIAGAFDAGATEVLVSDSHGDAQNIDVEVLDKRVQLVRSWPRPLLMVQGIDPSFDALVLVGYYASQEQFPAVLAHNITSQRIMGIKFNGTTMPDAGLAAAIAGEFGVPTVFVSGDQAVGQEMKRLVGRIETVAVKQAIGFYAATMMHNCRSRPDFFTGKETHGRTNFIGPCFGACSAFTHIMACTLAESPCDPFHRKLRQLRRLRRRFDCYRVERTSSQGRDRAEARAPCNS
jgi:D-amino peptidase